jgi:hypothetical protein
MNGKRITLRPKPSKILSHKADAWVQNRSTDVQEPIKRLTIDLPVSLHTRIKATCAMRGAKMVEEIRELLMQKYGNQ